MQDLSLATLASIDRFSTEIRIAAGRTLTRQGDAGRESFIIVDGTAALVHDRKITATITAGEVVTAPPEHDGRRTHDVIALTDMTILVSSAAELSSLLCDDRFRAWIDGRREVEHSGCPDVNRDKHSWLGRVELGWPATMPAARRG